MPLPIRSPEAELPLTPNVFNILLALAGGEKHGYGIMKDVQTITNGKVKLRLGTLYGAIQRMIVSELIEESHERPAPESDDERRRYYRLTDFGHKVLQAEVKRLNQLLQIAQQRHIFEYSNHVGETTL